MSDTQPHLVYDNPYRGASSYGPEDGEIFFGREAAADQLTTLVLAQRVCFLYAASGAGKSSLLAARVLPRLETRGWLPIEIRLGDDPLAAARQSVLQQAVLHPPLELACAQDLVHLLGADVALHQVAEQVAGLSHAMPAKRRLLRRRTLRVDDETAETLPMLARLARGGLPAADYLRALALVASQGPGALVANQNITLGRLLELLVEPAVLAGYDELLTQLAACAPGFDSMIRCLDGLARASAQVRASPLVLVFDQFEELFTRFADPDPSERQQPELDRPDWRHRPRLLDELARLFAPRADGPGDGEGSRPHRLLISIREDYIAELDAPAVRRLAPLDPQNAYRLRYLTPEGASDAIRQPAAVYGFSPPLNLTATIVADLLRESSHVEPAPLQVVCETLWNEKVAGGPALDLATYDRLGRAAGILGSYFGRQLDRLNAQEHSALAQVEALDLLAPLITANRTRNIVERRSLLDAPFRDVALRRRAFDFLAAQRILRVERRLKGEFVEIAHEFLIQSVLDEAGRRLTPEDARLRQALRALVHRRGADGSLAGAEPLQAREFELLHAVRHRIHWTAGASELMLRAALTHVRSADRAELALWADAALGGDEVSVARVLARLQQPDAAPLSLAEWAALLPQLPLAPIAVRHNPAVQRAALAWCVTADRGCIPFLFAPEPTP